MKKADRPLSVQIPSPSAEQPSWMRVGIVAVLGFAVGVAWPKLAGVRLGPNAPATAAETQAAASASAAAAPPQKPAIAARPTEAPPTASVIAAVPPTSAAASASAGPASGANGASGSTVVTVKPGVVLGCKAETGERHSGKACGALSFDALALPRLRKLASCPAAVGAEGVLTPKFHLDFLNSKFKVEMGRKNTVDNVDSFAGCLGRLFEKVSINAVTHEHAAYSVQYTITFAKGDPSKPAPAAAKEPAGAPSEANESKIAWDVAIVRDAPRTGAVVGRIPRGTSVQIVASETHWFKVRAGTTEGWLYRGAIGR